MSAAFAALMAHKPTATTRERFRVLLLSAAFAVFLAPKPTATTQERFRVLLTMSAAFAAKVAPKPTATTQERFRALPNMSAAFAVVVAPKPTATICQAAPKTATMWCNMALAMEQREEQPPTWLVIQYRPQPKSLQAEK